MVAVPTKQTFRKRPTGTRTETRPSAKRRSPFRRTYETFRVDTSKSRSTASRRENDRHGRQRHTLVRANVGVVRSIHRVRMSEESASSIEQREMHRSSCKVRIPTAAEDESNAGAGHAGPRHAGCQLREGRGGPTAMCSRSGIAGIGVPRDFPARGVRAEGRRRLECVPVFDLATYYMWGNGGWRGCAEAVQLFRSMRWRVCNGCANLGDRYVKGEGVEKDVPRDAMYQSACSKARGRCFYLGSSRRSEGSERSGRPCTKKRATPMFRSVWTTQTMH